MCGEEEEEVENDEEELDLMDDSSQGVSNTGN